MIKGINQLFSPEGTPKGYAFFSKNVIINDKLDEIVNAKGNKLIAAFQANQVSNIVGLISFSSKIIIFDIALTGNDRIGVYDEVTGLYTVKVDRNDLGFNPDFPITGKAKLNSKGQLIVAFTDYNVTPKYINLDTASNSDNISLYNLTLLSSNPDIAFTVIEGGGSVKTGVHFLSLQYVDTNRNSSNFSNLSPPIYVTQHNTLGSFLTTQGGKAGETSSKSIKFTITNIDTSFKKVRAILITKIDDIVSSNIYKEVEITGSTINFTITGSEIVIPITPEEVLTLNQVFDKVKHLTALDDQLFAIDIVTPPIIDFQNIANRIVLEWTSNPIYSPVVDQNVLEPYIKSANNQKTFIHDEVYAMYAQLELEDNIVTQWFHIPGKQLTNSHRGNSSIHNGIKFNGSIPKVFQLQCTAVLNGIQGSLGNPNTTADSKDSYAWGDFGVWENDDETYPDNFPDFAGEKVRHHRFPSCEWLRDNVYNSPATASSSYMKSMWDMLGIKFSLNTTGLDAELVSKIKLIRLGYAKRDTTNMSVLGYDVVQLAANPETQTDGVFDANIITSAGGNWRIAAAADDNDIRATNTYVRLHSPDVLQLRPSVDNIYLANQLRLKRTGLNDSYFTTGSITPYGRIINGGNDISGDIDVWVYVTNFMASDVLTVYPSTSRHIPLTKTKYLPANSKFTDLDGTFNNLLNEECLFGKPEVSLNIDIPGFSSSTNALKVQQGTSIESPGLYEETVLVAVKTPRTNFFTNYTDQIVVPISNTRFDPDFAFLVGKTEGDGDGFICVHSFLTMASAPMEVDLPFNLTEDDGIRCVKIFLCESRYNLNERYITQENYNTYFFPAGGFHQQTIRGDYWFTKINQLNCPVNQIQLSKSFSALNDLEQHGIYDHTADYQNELPYAIARSLKASRSTDFEDGWRQFKANDIFYTVKDKGRINNVIAWGTDKLIIHHAQAIYRTRDKAVLQSDITQISLGSGDLFAIEPQEATPTENGYGGTQHKFSCLLTEMGYVFADKEAGQLLLYDGGDKYQDIGKGLFNFFQDIFFNYSIGDNPYNNSGHIQFSYDKENSQLVLSLKADVSFTATYDLTKQEWVGLQPFLPNGMIQTRNSLYSFKNRGLYKHNAGKRGEFYGTIYPSFVDIIINDEPNSEKILSAINWITRVEKNGVNVADETITDITIWNDYFCTGKITLNKQENLAEYEGKNTNNLDRAWSFNEIQDYVKDVTVPFVGGIFDDYRPISSNIATDLAWFEKQEFRGKYFIIRLEYSNYEDKLVSLRHVFPSLKGSYS